MCSCSLNNSRRARCGNLLAFHDPLARLIKISIKKRTIHVEKKNKKKTTTTTKTDTFAA